MVAAAERFCLVQMILEFDEQESVPKRFNSLSFFIRGLPETKLVLCAVDKSWPSNESALAGFEGSCGVEWCMSIVFAEIVKHDRVEGNTSKCPVMKRTSERMAFFHKESVS